MSYKEREGQEGLFRGVPVKRTHGEIVIVSVPNSKLILKVGKGKEFV